MRAFEAACSVPWAMTEDRLRGLLEIANREHEVDLEALEARLGRKMDNTHVVTTRDGVATIPVEGPLFRYANLFTAISGATSLDMLATDLRTALDNPQVKAVLLTIDSPGGEVNGTGEFADMIYAARAGSDKPIWAYISNDGCSAAYWIASAAQKVIAAPTATIGSIGVIATVPGPTRTKDLVFVSSQSPNKNADPSTEAGRTELQRMVDDLGEVFVGTVARNRGVSTDKVLSDFGQGGVMIGARAVKAGLADEVGSYEGALAQLAGTAPPKKMRPRKAAGRTNVGLRDVLRALSNVPDEELQAALETTDDPPPTPQPIQARTGKIESEPDAAMQAELERVRADLQAAQARNQQLVVEQIRVSAKNFVEGLLHDDKIFPAEQDAWVAAYVQAALDDSHMGPCKDAEGAPTTRVAMIEAAFKGRPGHLLSVEQLTPEIHGYLKAQRKDDTGPRDGPMTPERRRELLAHTQLGKTHLDRANGSAK